MRPVRSALFSQNLNKIFAFLFHGNDAGLIGERAKQLAHRFNPNLEDVFSVTRLSGEMLLDESRIDRRFSRRYPGTGGRRLF